MTIVETSSVGVKVGMVGRGVVEAVGVTVGVVVCVLVGIGGGVIVGSGVTKAGVTDPLCVQAVRTKAPKSSAIKIRFNVYIPTLHVLRSYQMTTKTQILYHSFHLSPGNWWLGRLDCHLF